jgi:hypothetical protein
LPESARSSSIRLLNQGGMMLMLLNVIPFTYYSCMRSLAMQKAR